MMLRERNDFHGNDFSGADLIDVSFRSGTDLDRQILPTGPGYLYLPEAATRSTGPSPCYPSGSRPNSSPTSSTSFRTSCAAEIATGQRQLLQREKTYERRKQIPPDIAAVFALLQETLPR